MTSDLMDDVQGGGISNPPRLADTKGQMQNGGEDRGVTTEGSTTEGEADKIRRE